MSPTLRTVPTAGAVTKHCIAFIQEGVSAVGEEPLQWNKRQQKEQVCVVSLRRVEYYYDCIV